MALGGYTTTKVQGQVPTGNIKLDPVSTIDNSLKYTSYERPLYAASSAHINPFSGRYLETKQSSNLPGTSTHWSLPHPYSIVSSTSKQNPTPPGVASVLPLSHSNSMPQPSSQSVPRVLFQSQSTQSHSAVPEKSPGAFFIAALKNYFSTKSDIKSGSILSRTEQPTTPLPEPPAPISMNENGSSPPIDLYKLPLHFSSDKINCSLAMNGTSLKLLKEGHSVYSFSSDDECDQRNRRIDAALLEGEKEEALSTDYQKMRQQTQELDGIFPADHVSPYYTVMHFREVHKTEGELVFNLSLQMKEKDCFQTEIAKYDVISRFLQFKEKEWIQDVRDAISNKTVTPDLLNEYYYFQTISMEMKLKLRDQFYNASHFSDSAIYCDGCDLPRGLKHVRTVQNYKNGLLIRKFVGNEEVEYTDTRID